MSRRRFLGAAAAAFAGAAQVEQLALDWTPPGLQLDLEPADERLRLKGLVLAVLERLRQGPATGDELAAPTIGGRRAAARVHDLRRAGFTIDRRDEWLPAPDGGRGRKLATYTLVSEPSREGRARSRQESEAE